MPRLRYVALLGFAAIEAPSAAALSGEVGSTSQSSVSISITISPRRNVPTGVIDQLREHIVRGEAPYLVCENTDGTSSRAKAKVSAAARAGPVSARSINRRNLSPPAAEPPIFSSDDRSSGGSFVTIVAGREAGTGTICGGGRHSSAQWRVKADSGASGGPDGGDTTVSLLIAAD